MPRTNVKALKETLGGLYDASRCEASDRFVRRAHVLVNMVVTCATANGVTIPAAALSEMEALLAAHFYMGAVGGRVASKSIGRASVSYTTPAGNEDFLAQAKMFDTSGGCLTTILSGKTATVDWGGKTIPEQTDYEDRN